jgi:acetoin utilization deacetylase AcuC-like enzyme
MHVFTAPQCAEHEPGAGHPEAPARLAAVLAALRSDPAVVVTPAPSATLTPLLARHDAPYLAAVAARCAAGGGAFDADTIASTATWGAVLAATGAALAALDCALSGRGHAFAAIRPPGHHALRGHPMGFCFVNHVAVLAAEARRRGHDRVLIVDWDVHHGNGTQAMVESEPATRFVSMHQWPWWPGSGAAGERGAGNIFNLPRPPGLAPTAYLEALWQGVTAATADWTPDVVLVSAGYDSMRGDPLGGFTLEPEHYGEWTHRLRDRFPDAPVAMVLEGGYHPGRLAAGVLETVRALGG